MIPSRSNGIKTGKNLWSVNLWFLEHDLLIYSEYTAHTQTHWILHILTHAI